MAWRDHMLRLLARGMRTADGESLDVEIILRVLDQIDANPDISARLDGLDEQDVHSEILAFYNAQAARETS